MSELTVGQLRGLPVNNNVITVPTGHILYAPGSVLQVVNAVSSTAVNTTSTSFVTAGLSATITPRFANSRIFVTAHTPILIGNRTAIGIYTLFRGSVAGTNLAGSNGMGQVYPSSNSTSVQTVAVNAVDSPNTTSAQTYTLGFRQSSANDTNIVAQFNGGQGSITLMEIAS